MGIYKTLSPLLFALDAEVAHRATIAALKLVPARALPKFAPQLASDVAGLHFASPVGLAAGFDKDGEVPAAAKGLLMSMYVQPKTKAVPRPSPSRRKT